MERSHSLSDILMEELADLLDTENQMIGVLLKMAEASQLSALKVLLEEHTKASKEQADRLIDILSNIGQHPQGTIYKTMKVFVAKSEAIINDMEKGEARDAAIISVTQQMEQYEITEYKKACEHAFDLGHTRIVELLDKSIDEERVMNLYLNELAQYMINVQAIESKGSGQQTNEQEASATKQKNGGFYIPQEKFYRKSIKRKSKDADVSRFIDEGNPNTQEDSDKNKG